MLKALVSVAMLTVISGGALLVGGCKSDTASSSSTQQPYGLTGTSEQPKAYSNSHVDSKGHYRPDWE
jgi:hypothetical protein